MIASALPWLRAIPKACERHNRNQGVISLVAVAGLTVLVWNDPIDGRPGVIAAIVVVELSALYHIFVLDRRASGWSLFSTPAEGNAL